MSETWQDQPGGYGQSASGGSGYGAGGYGRSEQASAGYGQSAAAPAIPPTNVGWAVAAVILFWPVAFSAFTHSSNVTRLWLMGDYAGSYAASERARALGRIALFVFLGLMAAFVVLYVVLIVALVSAASQVGSTF